MIYEGSYWKIFNNIKNNCIQGFPVSSSINSVCYFELGLVTLYKRQRETHVAEIDVACDHR